MSDNIFNAAIKYQKLLDCQYNFIVGCKGKEYPISLTFSNDEFHHLAGLQYLNDIRYIRRTSRAEIFINIIQGSINDDYLSKSSNYSDILQRLDDITDLEKFLDSNKTIFKFNRSANPHSMINADFILKNNENKINTYFFIQRKSDGTYFGKSIFSRKEKEYDYTQGHTQCTLLFKEKIDLLTNERQVLYTHPSYKKELEQPTAGSQSHQNDNIKQIKFDSPVPQKIVHTNSGTVAAVLSAPNPLKDFLAKLRQSIAGLFKPKDKLSDTIPETSEEADQPEKEIISEEDKTAETEVVPEKPYSDELSELIKVRERFAAEEIELPEYGRALGIYLSTLKSKEMCEQVREILQKQLSECSCDDKRIICINTELREIKRYSNKHFSPHPKQTLDDLIEYARVEREKRDNEAMKAEPKEKQTTKSNDYYER